MVDGGKFLLDIYIAISNNDYLAAFISDIKKAYNISSVLYEGLI